IKFSETIEEIDKEIENKQESEHDPFTLLSELIGNACTNTHLTQTEKKGRRARRANLLVNVIRDSVKQISTLHVSTSENIRRLANCF
ncbi:LOW QUALITY PROTEIN: hypothetical protein PanWU01x14_074210, partial [Parasponia andersonii]